MGASAPVFKTLEEWEANPSEKMLVACTLINHELSSDTAPPITFDEQGGPIFPLVPPPLNTPQRNIAMYMEFTSNCASMASVLWVKFGINCMILDGSVSVDRRRAIIQAFACGVDLKGKPCRVLILTKVAGVGVNLSAADRLIIVVSIMLFCITSSVY